MRGWDKDKQAFLHNQRNRHGIVFLRIFIAAVCVESIPILFYSIYSHFLAIHLHV